MREKINIEKYLPTDEGARKIILNKYITDGRALGVIIEDILKAERKDLFVGATVIRTVKKGQKTIDFKRSKDKGVKRDGLESWEDAIQNRAGTTIVVCTGSTPKIGIIKLNKSDLRNLRPLMTNGVLRVDDLIEYTNGQTVNA